MKPKSVFIVRELDGTVKVITEGVLLRDIKARYSKNYDSSVKTSIFKQIASEMIREISGQSITRQLYEKNLDDYAETVNYYDRLSFVGLYNLILNNRNH